MHARFSRFWAATFARNVNPPPAPSASDRSIPGGSQQPAAAGHAYRNPPPAPMPPAAPALEASRSRRQPATPIANPSCAPPTTDQAPKTEERSRPPTEASASERREAALLTSVAPVSLLTRPTPTPPKGRGPSHQDSKLKTQDSHPRTPNAEGRRPSHQDSRLKTQDSPPPEGRVTKTQDSRLTPPNAERRGPKAESPRLKTERPKGAEGDRPLDAPPGSTPRVTC